MQKSTIGLVLFNDKFEDGSLPTPPLSLRSSTNSSITPRLPLFPPLSPLGKVPFFSLLHGRREKTRIHLASFIKKPKVAKVKKLTLRKAQLKTQDKKERKQNGDLQKRILECKTPEEIEALLIQEGVLKIDL